MSRFLLQAAFKSDIKKLYQALVTRPSFSGGFKGVVFPVSLEKNTAYMTLHIECGSCPFADVVDDRSWDVAVRKSQPYIKKACDEFRKLFGIDSSYKFKDVTRKASMLEKDRLGEHYRRGLSNMISWEPSYLRYATTIPNGRLFALLDVPSDYGTVNCFIHYSDSYRTSCAEMYIEIFGKPIKRRGGDGNFVTAPEIKVGSILSGIWGYSMTIVDFYEVVKRTESFVFVKELQKDVIEDEGPKGEMLMPVPGSYVSPQVYRLKIQSHGSNAYYFKSPKSGILDLWDGKPEYQNTWD